MIRLFRFITIKISLVLFIVLIAALSVLAMAQQLKQPPLTVKFCPDLTVVGIWAEKCTSCSCQCQGKSYGIYANVYEGIVVEIKNIGNAASGECRLEISAEKGFFSSGPNVYKNIPRIDPGKTYIVRVSGDAWHVFYNRYATGLRIHAIVDYQNKVSECKEDNNMKVVTNCEQYPVHLI